MQWRLGTETDASGCFEGELSESVTVMMVRGGVVETESLV